MKWVVIIYRMAVVIWIHFASKMSCCIIPYFPQNPFPNMLIVKLVPFKFWFLHYAFLTFIPVWMVIDFCTTQIIYRHPQREITFIWFFTEHSFPQSFKSDSLPIQDCYFWKKWEINRNFNKKSKSFFGCWASWKALCLLHCTCICSLNSNSPVQRSLVYCSTLGSGSWVTFSVMVTLNLPILSLMAI